MKILESDRLLLEEFSTDDAGFIFTLLNSPGWLQFIGDRGIKNNDDAKKYISDKLIASYKTNGFGLYLVRLKNENTPIGMCGLVKREGLDDVDIGFALSPGFFGKGYAFEAASATMNYAIHKLNFKRIVAITNTDNVNSINLLKKLKFNFEKMILIPNDAEELMLFVWKG
jgi:RimJ/RimL family protein N-acetyltransferase